MIKKIAFSLILSLLLFAGFSALAYTGLFGLIETRFYQPSVTQAALKEADRDREAVQGYFAGLEDSFAGIIREQALRRSFLLNRSEDDVLERSRLLEQLLERQAGLQSIRFIDAGGFRIHYSTLSQDTLVRDSQPTYRNYEAGPENPPYEFLEIPAGGKFRIILDAQRERIIFSYPFYDAFEAHRGTAVFTLSANSLTEALIAAGRIKTGEEAVIFDDPPGVILGLSPSGRNSFPAAEIRGKARNYRRGSSLSRLNTGEENTPVVLLSSQTNEGVFTGRIMSEKLFVFSPAMKIVLLVSLFLTSFLTIFLLFNLRTDLMTVVHARLRGIRTNILEECRRRKDFALPLLGRELEQRREDMRQEIKRTIKIKRNNRLEKEIDAYIDFAWNELEALVDSFAPVRDAREASPARQPSLPPGAGPGQDASLQQILKAPPRDAPFGSDAGGQELAEEGPPEAAAAPKDTAQQWDRVQTGAAPTTGATVSREQAAELEPVEAFPQTVLLSRPFTFTAERNSSPEMLPAPGRARNIERAPAVPSRRMEGSPAETVAGGPVFRNKNGITYVNRAYLVPNNEAARGLELSEEFKDLVDSVIEAGGR
ncbi:MAG: hypothetical protein LBT16_05065 [Treponema sp.]|nr:hypothetical protein [Treponema sp.]